MAREGRGQICLSMTGERLDELELPLAVNDNTDAVRHRVLRPDRRQVRRDDRDLGGRSRAHDPDGRRSRDQARGPRPARARLAAARARRRRAGARRPDRSGGRSRADRRAPSGRRDLRNHERRRDDVARAGAGEVRQAARDADDHDRGSDPVPDADRGARPPGRAAPTADRPRRVPRHRVRERPRQGNARRARERGHRRRRERAGPRALALPDRRRVSLVALRLRRAARRGDDADRGRKGAASCST